jgi:hypothetical protein
MPSKIVMISWPDEAAGGVPTPPIYYPPVGGGVPTPPIYYPPGVNVPPFPTHPIAPGGPPPGVWPGPGVPTPPIYYPPVGAMPPIYLPPPGVNVPTFPTHPIAPGGGGGVPMPPIYFPPGVNVPGFPTHPIAPGGGGQPPVVGWVPPGTGPENPISGGGYVVGWSPYFGWVVIPIGGATAPPPESVGEPTHPIAPGGPEATPK